MKAEIITIGTELLMGNTIDTNSAFISKQLEKIGIGTYYKQTVGDNIPRIIDALCISEERAELIILCGGIGPTRDDITKEAVAEFLNQDLLLDPHQVQKIQNYYEKNNRTMSESDFKQANYLRNGKIIPNDQGLATGSFIERDYHGRKQVLVILPGPPHEMTWMLTHYVLEDLKASFKMTETIRSQYLNFINIGEAQLASTIDDIVSGQTNPTIAIYAKPPLTSIRVTAAGHSDKEADALINKTSQILLERLEPYYLMTGENVSLESAIIKLLKEKNETLATAESLTGGKVLSELTSVAGAGDVIVGGFVTYQTSSKTKLLQIDPSFIEKYSVVSSQVAVKMAEQTLKETQADYALSLTGVAGPTELDGHPVGQVFISLAQRNGQSKTNEFHFNNQGRDFIREKAKNAALMMLLASITK